MLNINNKGQVGGIFTMSKKCSKCSQKITADDDFIYCDCCKNAYHNTKNCFIMTTTEARALQLKNQRLVVYFCDSCMGIFKQAPLLLKRISSLENEIVELKNELKELKDTVSSNNHQELPEEFEKLKSDLGKIQMNSHGSQPNNEDIANEVYERQRRSKNIMIFNLPEVASNSRDSDSSIVSEIFKDITSDEIQINNVMRIGKKNRNGARALKIVLEDAQDALFLVRNKSKVNKERKIYLAADQTPMQLSKLKSLKEELATRSERGEKNLKLKYINGQPRIVEQKN